ncbi:hypothetical protein [Thiomonas sp.]|jgi:hypothetical protein|uniref:hypothetical protein n=1 Tax=Thiomonas sp. TaxID=2047785 RepID=UPI00258843A4|nr:hypothetical protein [Thiomonas sp.]
MKSGWIALTLVALLSGCATYNLTLQPRGQGAIARGTAKQLDKSVSVELDGRTFTGHYAYVQGGSFTLGSATSGTQYATGNTMGVSAAGNGDLLAHSPDGHNLHCVFSFSSWTQAGYGVCQVDGGKVYDLQISR